ncbi:hypothetical protein [Dokdonella sp.]|uniref:hypothetical protein n=1 Tax=Dokdonella sp. TaxID=2291710 RepID=UPI002F42A1B3
MDTIKTVQVAELLPGDVLLHMGRGQLSKLIAWVGDSGYSHAAMVIGRGELIEAATKGVRHASLAERTHMGAAFDYVDVFRPLRPTPRDTADIAALLAAADVYLGRPYPMTSLLTLGIVCAVRNKIPGDERLHEALRMALDLVVQDDPGRVVCSELVYRGYAEAATKPPQALRLPITNRASQSTPLPKIDLVALALECLEDYQRANPKGALRATAAQAELPALLAQARGTLGIGGLQTSGAGASAPNPKTVLPADLEFSSGLRRLGRLPLNA